MDSYSFQFERMSNVDLHPLSLPVSRLSPAKSSSSIAEQFAHHRHGKGDSAYSSFSGGSTAQDYPSPFLPDDLQSNSFGHYADFKYVKAVYHPARALQTDTRTMDQLCRSVEAISQQYRNNTNIKANHDNNNPTQSPCPSILRPPPIPARMDSFITTKNLENTRVHRHSAEIQPQQPPQQPRPHSQLQSQAYGLNVQPSNYHTRFASNPEYLFITDNKALRKRAYSVNDWLGSDTQRLSSPWTTGVINSSIQHKGQFYFVTGVCRAQSASSCGSDAGSKRPPLPETYQLREKERCHSTLEGLFRPLQQSSRSSSGTIQDEVFTSLSQDQDLSAWNQDQENRRLSSNSIQSTQSFDTLEEINSRNHEMGRHTSSNPVFYCGPDRNHPPQSASQTEQLPSHVSNEQVYQHKKVDQAKKGTRQPLGDIGSEKINKETTPLLYHLTGASRAALQPKKKSNSSIQGKEINLRTGHDRSAVDEERPLKTEADKNSGAEISACNTLDDSFKKYYKEKLKDAQSKVLRATSFKRRDLQLSWPHRIRPKPEMKPPVLHAFSSSQDSETSTETLTPSLTSEETETGKPKDVNWCSVTVAQPQAIRMRGKKRLTPEQKKMCYSEPEKLNHLGGAPFHSSCRSFGNESENVFAAEGEDQRCAQQGEPGLVAARRKLFETRDQAFSVPAAAKFSLKHLQHKALVEYMERKTGHKLPEPQEPGPLVPHASRHRHSLGEKTDSLKKAVAEGRQRARAAAQRGKSMEELGTSKITRLPPISKSSEQLDTLGSLTGPRRSSLKNHSDPEEEPSAVMRNSSRSTSPTSPSSCRVRGLSGPHRPVSNTPTSSRPPSESNPPSPRGLESSEDDWHHEVSLSCGVTTDPWLWNPPPEEPSPTSDSVFDDGATPATAGTPPEKASASPSTSVCDGDAGEQLEDEENSSSGDEEADERRETEERGTPGGETEGAQEPAGRPQWEELVEAVVAADPSLSRVMYPLANRKTALMLMEQLLSEDTLLMEEHYKKKQELQGAPERERTVGVLAHDVPSSSCVSHSCFSSPCKLKLMFLNQQRLLVSHIEEHLRSLEEMRVPLQAEMERHAAHGAALELLVREHCLPVELERYNLFIGDLERVVNLLLCLSARLARVQNALSTVDQHTDAEEKQSLDSRHRLLCKQREDAKDLKVNLDRRENVVSTFLSRQLSAEQLQDYRRFVQTKASLLIRQKDLEEKQRLGEEQLEALSSSLNL
uniref:Shroom family member 1 n=1 Tax=Takifugu rubripes TaxID=31033 RepID=A0A3B5K3L6_TAKRU